MPRLLLALLITWLAASSALAREEERMLRSPHAGGSLLILGGKSTAIVQELATERRTAGFGVALFAETTLIHDRLELELGVGLTRTVDQVEFAFEPLFKLPLRGLARLDPYFAVGPVLFKGRSSPAVFGGQLVVGGYIWLHERVGLDLDVAAALVNQVGPALELAFGLGPVVRI